MKNVITILAISLFASTTYAQNTSDLAYCSVIAKEAKRSELELKRWDEALTQKIRKTYTNLPKDNSFTIREYRGILKGTVYYELCLIKPKYGYCSFSTYGELIPVRDIPQLDYLQIYNSICRPIATAMDLYKSEVLSITN